MKARISLLHKTEAEWLALRAFKPDAGEVIVYDPDSTINYSRVKIGDGVHTLVELPFLIEEIANTIVDKYQSDYQRAEILDCGSILKYL